MNLQIADMMGEFTNRLMYGAGEPSDKQSLEDEVDILIKQLMKYGVVAAFEGTLTIKDVMDKIAGDGDKAAVKMLKPETYQQGKEELESLIYDEAKSMLLDMHASI